MFVWVGYWLLIKFVMCLVDWWKVVVGFVCSWVIDDLFVVYVVLDWVLGD